MSPNAHIKDIYCHHIKSVSLLLFAISGYKISISDKRRDFIDQTHDILFHLNIQLIPICLVNG